MEKQCEQEVIGLHKFFEQWFKAEITNDKETLNRFHDVLADEFMLIMPSGNFTFKDPIVKQIESGYGSHEKDKISYELWVQNINCRLIENNLCLVTYEEWGRVDGEINARLSSALFRKKEGTINGVEWIHVHETFLPND
ncbi:MAG: DUF4440 domain-containing protein [Candidatus Heimdallarchaeota archaeon]